MVIQSVEQFHGFPHRQKLLQGGLLELDAGLLPEPVAQWLAAIANGASGGGQAALQHLDGGALAGPVRAEQAKASAGVELQADAVHGLHFRVVLDEAGGLK